MRFSAGSRRTSRRRTWRVDKKLSVPVISRFVATHYSYEALVVAQAKLNPLAIRQQRLQAAIDGARREAGAH